MTILLMLLKINVLLHGGGDLLKYVSENKIELLFLINQ